MLLVALLVAVAGGAGVCDCSANPCALVPPPTAGGFPCYEGSIDDAKFCFKTDPLLAPNTTWACGTCTSFGYPTYLRNDPIYVNMGLWSSASTEKN